MGCYYKILMGEKTHFFSPHNKEKLNLDYKIRKSHRHFRKKIGHAKNK